MQLSEIIKIGPRAARRQESTEKEEKGKRKEKVLINREERVHGNYSSSGSKLAFSFLVSASLTC